MGAGAAGAGVGVGVTGCAVDPLLFERSTRAIAEEENADQYSTRSPDL